MFPRLGSWGLQLLSQEAPDHGLIFVLLPNCEFSQRHDHIFTRFLKRFGIQKRIPKISLFFFLNKLIYLFLAALGLCCWARSFSSCSERGLLFVAVLGLLIVVASLVAEHGL